MLFMLPDQNWDLVVLAKRNTQAHQSASFGSGDLKKKDKRIRNSVLTKKVYSAQSIS